MTDIVTSSIVAALISGVFALWNTRKTNTNTSQIEDFKGAVDRDLARLKARLSHGQIISSTQWNAEFSSYQGIWKGIVGIRTIATKIVLREGELTELGLPNEYLASDERIKLRQALLLKFQEAGQRLLLAIHDNAPFYPASIRMAANDTHGAAIDLLNKHLAAFNHLSKGVDLAKNGSFIADCMTILGAIIDGVDLVESLIRDRLAAIEVMNNARV